MTLAAGTRIGAFEVLGPLGSGGMGEVYRARDTRLNRDVALKIIPETFALDADRIARFEREAQLLASLNHPNIAAIYGFEDVGPRKALVLELVDGETLTERIARGPVPPDEAFAIAAQIAEALESAHEQGIIHRDLKPANVKVRDDGTVKVLDFGLAKMLERDATGSSSSLSLSPTITSPAMTQIGMILGTAAYMAPEQARGKPADRRSDVWAFGCVLFEMLSGVQAFAGDDVTDVIAAVVRGEPPWQALPAGIPPPVRLLLQRCLEKDRRRRISDISAALFVLREPHLAVPAATAASAAASAAPTRSWRAIAVVAASLLAVAAISGIAVWSRMRTAPPRVSRLAMVLDQRIARNVAGNHVVVSPDGTEMVYVAFGAGGGLPAIYGRRLDSFESVRLAEPGVSPFFRPDGKEIGFFFQNGLRRVAITGGPSADVARIDGQPRGATWGGDNTIVFATSATTTGLMRVAAGGGTPDILTKPENGFDHVLPRFLPGDEAVLFTMSNLSAPDASQIAVLDLRSSPPQTKIVARGGADARYLSTGHLLYLAGDSLRLLPFDLERLEVTDDTPTPVLSGMAIAGAGTFAHADISASGTLVYLPDAAGADAGRTLTWVDRSGRETPIDAPPRPYLYPRLSPDETRIAVDARDAESDIWVWNLLSSTPTRVTRDPGLDRVPVWFNNDEIFYTSSIGGAPNIYRHRADGTGTPEPVAVHETGDALFAQSLAGSRLIVANTVGGMQSADLLSVGVAGPGDAKARAPAKLEPLVPGPAGEINGSVSPDGRWLAYQVNEAGTNQVYVQPFGAGATGLRQAVSPAGGIQPHWSADSRELFYVSAKGEMMAIGVKPGSTWAATPPKRLFDASTYHLPSTGNPFLMYDVARDGRFLMLKTPEGDAAGTTAPDFILVVQNWIEELLRPTAR